MRLSSLIFSPDVSENVIALTKKKTKEGDYRIASQRCCESMQGREIEQKINGHTFTQPNFFRLRTCEAVGIHIDQRPAKS